MTTTRKTRYYISALGCGAALTVTCAFADQVPGTQTGEPVRQPVQPAKPAPTDMVKVAPGAQASASMMADTGARIPVSQFRFSGNQAVSSETLGALLASRTGKSLTLTELTEAAGVVQSYYRAHGWFLAQAYVPAQSPAAGVVDIAVLEGRIDSVTINVADGAPISKAYATNLANHFLKAGQSITENGIESPLLLLRDVPRVDAKSVIDPGTTLGSAAVTVNVVTDPAAPRVNGRVQVDNYGNPLTGATRLGVDLNVNNPYGYGDQLSLSGFFANKHGNGFGRAAYSLPVGPLGTRVGVSAARLNYALAGATELLKLSKPYGIANVFALNAAHPLIRTKDSNLFIQVIGERKNLEDLLQAPALSDKRSLTSGRLQLNGDLRDDFAGVTIYSLSGTRGKLRIDDPARSAFDRDPIFGPQTEGMFSKLLYSVQRLQQFAPTLHGMFSVAGQRGNRNLHSAEQFAIGGDDTVRAFPVGFLVGDDGLTATAELRWAPSQLKIGRFEAVGTLFYDYGQLTIHHDNKILQAVENKPHISGYGVGMNVAYGERFLFKVAVAWQGNAIKYFDVDRQATIAERGGGSRVWAQAAYSF